MARGWESKSVESQMEEAAEFRRTTNAAKAKLSAEQIAKDRELESLELSRTRVLHDLAKAKGSHYSEQLEAALHHLDKKIAALK
jgi:hypothetical protein